MLRLRQRCNSRPTLFSRRVTSTTERSRNAQCLFDLTRTAAGIIVPFSLTLFLLLLPLSILSFRYTRICRAGLPVRFVKGAVPPIQIVVEQRAGKVRANLTLLFATKNANTKRRREQNEIGACPLSTLSYCALRINQSKMTLISGLENYGLDPNECAAAWRKKFASSTR